LAVLVAACGARTGLLAPEEIDASPPDAKPDVHHDASIDVAPDVVEEEIPDVIFPDVPIISDCPDAGSTFVYVLGSKNELYSFYPPTLEFKLIGVVKCSSTSTPNSMAVTRSGIAFANFLDGNLFEISTANAACKPTTYVPSNKDFQTYGMGYASDADGGETLYVAGNGTLYATGLATIDTTAFALTTPLAIQPQTFDCELTGTGAGRLFGFCPFGSGGYVQEIDPVTAKIISSVQISAGGKSSFAFAFWGGDFWIFTGSGGVSNVTDYDPIAKTETIATTAPIAIVGAGVSTCAPQ
jgi:hypothetical protein